MVRNFGVAPRKVTTIFQTFQNKVLRCIVNAPLYIRNQDIYKDLKIASVDGRDSANCQEA
jgi:hypothetical protein